MLAVIADIHGNLAALEAVLADLKQTRADQLVCLGDVASFGPQPRETLQRVQELRCPVVMGNADAAMLESPPPDPTRPALFTDIERWCAEQLSDTDRAFIQTFQQTVGLELDGLPILCFHGSPNSYNDEIVATTPDETLAEFFQECAPLMFGGHTHTQLLRRYQDLTFVNPGSVGLPFEVFPDGSVRNPRAYAYGLQRSFYGPITFRSKVTSLGFSLYKRPQRESYQSCAEVGSTTEGSESPQFVKPCHMRKPCPQPGQGRIRAARGCAGTTKHNF